MLAGNHIMQLILGLIIWSLWFIVAYGGLSVACVIAPPPVEAGAFTWVNLALSGLTLTVMALLLIYARRCWRAGKENEQKADKFIATVATAVHLSAAVSTLAVGLPLVFLPPCL